VADNMTGRRLASLVIVATCLVAPVVAFADEPQYALGINGNYIDPKLSWLGKV